MTDNEKLTKATELMNEVRDKVKKMFQVFQRKVNISWGERQFIEKLIKETDIESVTFGFREAMANEVEKLSYIRAVAQKHYEEKARNENLRLHNELKKEDKAEGIKKQYYDPKQHGSLLEMLNKYKGE